MYLDNYIFLNFLREKGEPKNSYVKCSLGTFVAFQLFFFTLWFKCIYFILHI